MKNTNLTNEFSNYSSPRAVNVDSDYDFVYWINCISSWQFEWFFQRVKINKSVLNVTWSAVSEKANRKFQKLFLKIRLYVRSSCGWKRSQEETMLNNTFDPHYLMAFISILTCPIATLKCWPYRRFLSFMFWDPEPSANRKITSKFKMFILLRIFNLDCIWISWKHHLSTEMVQLLRVMSNLQLTRQFYE